MSEKVFTEEKTTAKSSSDQDTVEDLVSTKAQRYITKLDLRLIPVLGCTYTILFLDRTNIANARIEGLEKGLKMPANGYNTCLWIFFIPFVLIEIPSNLIMSLPRIKPNIFLGCNMIVLGIIATCQGLTHSYGGLLALRFLMGIFEATLPAGAAFLIGEYYTRKEASLRFACFFTFGVLGPCISGLLAYGIRNMNGTQGKEGWRWIFILEGIFTIFISFFVFAIVPDFPEKTKFLSAAEKEHLLDKLHRDKGDQKLDLKSVNWVKRFPFVLMGITLALVGWIIQVAYSEKKGVTAGVRYFSLFAMSGGTFIQMAMLTAWMTNNLRGRASIGVGTAVILGLGNCANFVASNVFIKREAPFYPTGFRTGLGLTVFGAVVCVSYVGVLWGHNRKVDRKRREFGGEDDQKEYRYVY
ncbi:MFS general substrate transporter [Lindgomyces ingoldianus]|uniref:MFS general substrate transporter n=1 Tax=Lindgomyces ingoldianus TaxID=673940 RepID=A0ACB6QSK1_9PLEO|nr:MFS general substrate transporter [Lindgomyces ingoldianus]KAF2469999.1 MFS general substrate transporter [Lindgomyces ingoldianus]